MTIGPANTSFSAPQRKHHPLSSAMSASEASESMASLHTAYLQATTGTTHFRSHISAEKTAIDRSARFPVLLFIASGLTWLLISSFLGLIAAIKLHFPDFLSTYAFLTYGRVYPAATNAFLYGWLTPCCTGIGLWLLARLCRAHVAYPSIPIAAWMFWNTGVTLGVLGILGGSGTSISWLDFPNYASVILFIGYAFVAVWAVLMFVQRPAERFVYISQWYLFAAFLWFPWVYASANLFIHFIPIEASARLIAHQWFMHNLYSFWFAPVALAIVYYLLPKVLGKPVYSYGQAMLGFWAYAICFGWNGLTRLIDGPVPAWMTTVSIVATILMIIPLAIIINNFFGTLEQNGDAFQWSPTVRFAIVGAICFVAATLESIFLSSRSVSRILNLTEFVSGYEQLALYGFVSMCLFAGLYYMIPRLTNWGWASSALIRWHFWLMVTGVGSIYSGLSLAGFFQGYGLADKAIPMTAIGSLMQPFLWFQTLAYLLICTANVVFVALFIMLITRLAGQRLPFAPTHANNNLR